MNRIIKHNLVENFTIIPNEILQRPDISARAKGLFCYLQSLPNDWIFYKKEIVKHFTEGKDALNGAFEELEKNGYLVPMSSQSRRKSGKFAGNEYVLYQYPNNELPKREIRHGECGFTDAGNPQLLNTNSNKELNGQNPLTPKGETGQLFESSGQEQDQLKKEGARAEIDVDQVVQFLAICKRREGFTVPNLKVTAARRKQIQARAKEGFTIEDFRAAISHRVKLWAHDKKMKQYLTPETLFRASNFAKYVEAAQEEVQTAKKSSLRSAYGA